MQLGRQKKLIDNINAIEIKSDKDYRWIWEYAKFRFSNSASGLRGAEDKAMSLLKFVASVAGAAWLIFTYLLRQRSITPADAVNAWLVIASIVLVCSFGCAVWGLVPTKRLQPFREKVGIQFINNNPSDSSRPLGRFTLGLMLSSDYYEEAITRTSYLVVIGTLLAIIAISMFITGFCSYPFWLPSSDHQHRTSYYRYPGNLNPSVDLSGLAIDQSANYLLVACVTSNVEGNI